MTAPGDKPLLLNSPRWRYDLLTTMVDHKETMPRSQPDRALRVGFNYFRSYEDSKIPNRHRRLMFNYPHLYQAHALFEHNSGEKWQIEAAITANVSAEEIGPYVAQEPETIRTYETYFYDIRSKLKSPGYIYSQIFLPAIQHGLDGRDYDFMMKTIAYSFGWENAKMFVSGGVLIPEARQWLKQVMEDDLRKLGWQAVKGMPINGFTAPKIIEACLKLKEIEVTKGSGAAQEEATKIFGMLLESCATTILPNYELTDVPLLTDEPRVRELMGGPSQEVYLKPVQGVTS